MGSLVSKVTRPASRSKSEKMSASPVAMVHLAQAQSTAQLPLIANDNAFLGDVATSEQNDPDAPVTAGFFRLEKGKQLEYTYTYHEMKIILEGSFRIADEAGNKVTARPGDVFYFAKGAKITFETDDRGLAFYTGARKKGTA